MATTYNFTNGSISGAMYPAETTLHENEIVVRRNIVDFSLQTLDAGEGDIAQVLKIPAKTTVLRAGIRVITAETANGTVDLGYGGGVDEWGAGVSLATADAVVGMLDSPVYFASADTIDIVATIDVADVDIDGAKIEVFALMYKHVDSN
jgi:hypothetical protein